MNIKKSVVIAYFAPIQKIGQGPEMTRKHGFPLLYQLKKVNQHDCIVAIWCLRAWQSNEFESLHSGSFAFR